MKRTNIGLVLILIMLLAVNFVNAQNFEGFETGNFLSYNWQFSGAVNWNTTFDDPYEGIICAKSGEISDDQYSKISITMEVIETSEISFFWKVDSEQNSDFLVFYLDDDEAGSISGNQSWQEFTINIPVGYHTFSWSYEKNDEGQNGEDSAWLDNIIFPITTTTENDLAINYIQGPTILYQGNSGIYNVLIKNYGSNDQDDYIVNLYREGGILLDQLIISNTISSEEEIIHHLVWIIPPDEPEANTYIYAEVVLAGDENISNNVTDNLIVDIYELGLAQIFIGMDNHMTNWYPFKFHMNASLSETIYRSYEISYTGNIHAIGYRYLFEEAVPDAPVQIFMGMVSQINLAAGWIPAGSLTPIFDGNLDFYSGLHSIVIPLDEPFSYTGNNLCILSHKVFMNETFSINNEFLESISTSYYDRTLAIGSPNQLSPASPPSPGFLFSRIPNITLYMEITNLGTIEGHVYDELGNTISTAAIDIQLSSLDTYSNGSGFYQFGNVPEGDYDLIASKPGYESATMSGSVITDEVTVIDFILNSLPTVQIEGRIIGSIDPTIGLVNASIDLLGNENYQTQTDNDGNFIFAEVYGNESYEFNVTAIGYDSFVEQIDVQTDDIDLGTITLNEFAPPVTNVTAIQNLTGTELTLDWNPVNTDMREFEFYTIYRFLEVNNNIPANWIELENSYNDTTYIDLEWNTLPSEFYQYAIVANYTNGVTSDAALSNTVLRLATGNDDLIPELQNNLNSIYPNPFNPSTNISYTLSKESQVELTVLNVRGQKVATIIDDKQRKGFHHARWEGKNDLGRELSSGIYFVCLKIDSKKTAIKKCILMK